MQPGYAFFFCLQGPVLFRPARAIAVTTFSPALVLSADRLRLHSSAWRLLGDLPVDRNHGPCLLPHQRMMLLWMSSWVAAQFRGAFRWGATVVGGAALSGGPSCCCYRTLLRCLLTVFRRSGWVGVWPPNPKAEGFLPLMDPLPRRAVSRESGKPGTKRTVNLHHQTYDTSGI